MVTCVLLHLQTHVELYNKAGPMLNASALIALSVPKAAGATSGYVVQPCASPTVKQEEAGVKQEQKLSGQTTITTTFKVQPASNTDAPQPQKQPTEEQAGPSYKGAKLHNHSHALVSLVMSVLQCKEKTAINLLCDADGDAADAMSLALHRMIVASVHVPRQRRSTLRHSKWQLS